MTRPTALVLICRVLPSIFPPAEPIRLRQAFPCGTRMDRDLVEVAGVLDGKVDVCFLTSHLESLKDGSRLRCVTHDVAGPCPPYD